MEFRQRVACRRANAWRSCQRLPSCGMPALCEYLNVALRDDSSCAESTCRLDPEDVADARLGIVHHLDAIRRRCAVHGRHPGERGGIPLLHIGSHVETSDLVAGGTVLDAACASDAAVVADRI